MTTSDGSDDTLQKQVTSKKSSKTVYLSYLGSSGSINKAAMCHAHTVSVTWTVPTLLACQQGKISCIHANMRELHGLKSLNVCIYTMIHMPKLTRSRVTIAYVKIYSWTVLIILPNLQFESFLTVLVYMPGFEKTGLIAHVSRFDFLP